MKIWKNLENSADASWGKVFFATVLAVFGGMVLYKSNAGITGMKERSE